MSARAHALHGSRPLALLLLAALSSWGACLPESPLAPVPGFRDAARLGFVDVPGGRVDTAGGNLMIERLDLSLDTLLGTHEIRAVYNSATGEWLWSFQLHYDGTRLVDATGAVHASIAPAAGRLTPDGTVAGTHWVRLDEDTVKTRGGLAHHFDAAGRLSHIAWATLDYPRIEFTETRIRQCALPGSCTPLFDLALDASGRPTTITDARTGRTASFAYDAFGRLVTARSPLDISQGGPGLRYEYGEGGLLTAVIRSEGERIEYAYQADRRILHVTQVGEGDPRHRFAFHAMDAATGRFDTVHTNPLGGETRYRFDALRRLREVERTLTAEVTVYEYGKGVPSLLRPASVTRPSGVRTRFTFDENDDLVRVEEPGGNVVTIEYAGTALHPEGSAERPVRRMEDSLGLRVETHYRPDGRFSRIVRPGGETITADYDGALLESRTDPFGIETRFEAYGAHGHWIQATSPASPFPARRAFDPVGNLLVTAAGLQDGGVLDRGYDGNRNVASIRVAATARGEVTAQALIAIPRRSDGRPLRVERPQGADHRFVYDGIGRLRAVQERVDGVWRETRFEHDAAGNVTARERPNGMREEYGYDAYGRLTRRAALRHGVLEGEALITWEDGRPATWSGSKRGVTETYGYDDAGRLRRIDYSSGETAILSHDLRGRVTETLLRTPGQPDHRVRTAYDLAGRQTRVELDGELLAEMTHVAGRQVRVRTGNGVVRETAYDDVTGQVSGFTSHHPVHGVLEQTSITRSVDGERTLVSSRTSTPLASTEERHSLGVGGLLSDPDRRVGNRVWGWEDGEGGERSYRFDELGNRVDDASGDSFHYNAERNRLESATLGGAGVTLDYTYDEAGFVTSRNGEAVEWTASGRPAAIGSTAIEWDMAERPISMRVAGQRHAFPLFGGAVQADPETGAWLGLDLGLVSVSFSSEARLYRHRDFRGNVSLVSDESGAIVAHHRYTSYGLDASFGPAEGGSGFAGGLELGDGLLALGARVYDSRVGRFLSPDPVLQPASQYAYTYGDPVHFWDPDGAQPQSASGSAEAEARFVAALGAALQQVTIAAAATVIAAGATPPPVQVAAVVIATIEIAEAIEAVEVAVDAYVEWQDALAAEGKPTGLESLTNLGGGGCRSNCGPDGPNGPQSPQVSEGCAPSRLHSLPHPERWLALLLPLQIALAGVALRRRQQLLENERQRGDEREHGDERERGDER